jgi:hypothetical protein
VSEIREAFAGGILEDLALEERVNAFSPKLKKPR